MEFERIRARKVLSTAGAGITTDSDSKAADEPHHLITHNYAMVQSDVTMQANVLSRNCGDEGTQSIGASNCLSLPGPDSPMKM